MGKFLPPICLCLALITLISGFALLAVPPPEPDMKLHQARLGGDEKYRQLLEDELRRRQRSRSLLIGGLWTSTVLFTVAAFVTMRGVRKGA